MKKVYKAVVICASIGGTATLLQVLKPSSVNYVQMAEEDQAIAYSTGKKEHNAQPSIDTF